MVNAETLTGIGGMNNYEAVASMLGISTTATFVLVLLLSVWILTWKGFALWKSANKKSLIWFIVLLVFNTLGILEILYIFVFSKISFKSKKKK
ncbi:MAG: DUF5652 family protein [Candidatus Pacearchaeota archaeon]|jgi:hypothetical protein